MARIIEISRIHPNAHVEAEPADRHVSGDCSGKTLGAEHGTARHSATHTHTHTCRRRGTKRRGSLGSWPGSSMRSSARPPDPPRANTPQTDRTPTTRLLPWLQADGWDGRWPIKKTTSYSFRTQNARGTKVLRRGETESAYEMWCSRTQPNYGRCVSR
jgi:hypothetical protein